MSKQMISCSLFIQQPSFPVLLRVTSIKRPVFLGHGWTLSTLRRLVRSNALMGCKACEQRRQKDIETRRQIRDEKVARLTKGSDEGDAVACRVLRSLLATEAYNRENKFRSEHHRRD